MESERQGVLLVVNLHILHINKTDFVADEASAEMSQHKMAKEAPNKYKIKWLQNGQKKRRSAIVGRAAKGQGVASASEVLPLAPWMPSLAAARSRHSVAK